MNMPTDYAYIDSYFKKELNQEELEKFEQRIKSDNAFAEEVAFYCCVMSALKEQSADERKEQFRKIYEQNKSHTGKAKPALVKRLWPYIAAVAVITGLIVGYYVMYMKPVSIQSQANEYIRQHFEVQMGVNMGGADSMDAAMQLYNEDKLPEALQSFQKIIQAGNTNRLQEEVRMAGIVSLRLADYDKAIDYFTQLENITLYSNPGKLYHALALIKRDRTGDRETAKQLLLQVINQDLEGKETAQKWMESF
jgi:tetratricopeptide (TPR) repeat protein